MKLAHDLSERGFFIFPVQDRRKFPTRIGSKTWDWYMEQGEQELLHAHLLRCGNATGAAIAPAPKDPIQLFILDLDNYGTEFDEVWMQLAPGEAVPDGLGIVHSASGGWHLWFRLPDGTNTDSLPATIDLGNGLQGEIRASGPARRLLMLPESQVTNKHGKLGTYKAIGNFDVGALPVPPSNLLTRLLARKGDKPRGGKDSEGIPTEAIHLVRLLDKMEDIDEGTRNIVLAQIGQVLGRISPAEKPTDALLSRLWESVGPKLGDLDQGEFQVAVASGWKTGRKNAETYGPREKHPTVSDVRAECEAVFSALPWLIEIRDSGGKTREWQVGFGGSPKRPEEARHITKVKDLGEVLPTLSRLTSADPDTVVRSPLFIQPGWERVLRFMLMSERGIDQLGVPPEERFWALLEDWSRIASNDLLFLERWTDKRPGSSQAFIVWPICGDPPAVVLPPALQEILLMQVGDIPKAKRLVKKHLLPKTLRGASNKFWTLPLTELTETTQERIGDAYERFIQQAPLQGTKSA